MTHHPRHHLEIHNIHHLYPVKRKSSQPHIHGNIQSESVLVPAYFSISPLVLIDVPCLLLLVAFSDSCSFCANFRSESSNVGRRGGSLGERLILVAIHEVLLPRAKDGVAFDIESRILRMSSWGRRGPRTGRDTMRLTTITPIDTSTMFQQAAACTSPDHEVSHEPTYHFG